MTDKETTFDDYLKEQLKDPEFRKEYEKLCDEDTVMNNDLISRSELKKALHDRYAFWGDLTKYEILMSAMFETFNKLIDNAPTVEPFEPDYVGAERVKARQRGYEEGYRNGMEIGKTLNPKIKQGEWIKNIDKFGLSYICPFCGHEITGIPQDLNYCCKCGAKMKIGGEE